MFFLVVFLSSPCTKMLGMLVNSFKNYWIFSKINEFLLKFIKKLLDN